MRNDSELDDILKQMATEHRPQLPSPGFIWFRAQLARKVRQKERIELPLVVMRVLTILIGAVLLLAFVTANWAEIHDAIHHSGTGACGVTGACDVVSHGGGRLAEEGEKLLGGAHSSVREAAAAFLFAAKTLPTVQDCRRRSCRMAWPAEIRIPPARFRVVFPRMSNVSQVSQNSFGSDVQLEVAAAGSPRQPLFLGPRFPAAKSCGAGKPGFLWRAS